jgi:hypothetical protein
MAPVASCAITVTSGNDAMLRVAPGVIVGEGRYSGLQYFNSGASFTIRVSGRS